MGQAIFALIVPLSGMPDNSLPPGFGPPPGWTPPVDPGYGRPGFGGHPDQGLPGYGHPDQGLPGHGHPAHPIIIPPEAIGPGLPSRPIFIDPGFGVGRPDQPDQGLPGGGGHPWAPGHRPDRPEAPIVYPPGLPDNGLPATPGLPPLHHPSHPIVGVPGIDTLPTRPGFGGGRPDRPDQGLPGSGARPDQGLPGGGGGGTQPLPPDAGSGVLPEGSVLLIPVPTDKPIQFPPGVPTGSKPMLAWGGRGTLPLVCWIPPQAQPK